MGCSRAIKIRWTVNKDVRFASDLFYVLPKCEAMEDRANIIKIICEALSSGDTSGASEIARRHYPFLAPPTATRKFTEAQALRVFVRVGFVDRYSGNRLLFPPVLRLLSVMLPDAFPFHRNWKMNETHPAYWELFPTLTMSFPLPAAARTMKTTSYQRQCFETAQRRIGLWKSSAGRSIPPAT